MLVNGVPYRTIWLADDRVTVEIIDQTKLPHEFKIEKLESVFAAANAIKNMLVRGAPLIGATAAYGMALGIKDDPSNDNLKKCYDLLLATRPTAVNLRWALDDLRTILTETPVGDRKNVAYKRATDICNEDIDICSNIGEHGSLLIKDIYDKNNNKTVNILTHCNAGWLATVDWGTALAPIYKAFDAGVDLHVWVDETRPRNQGASLTAWELGQHGVPHTIIVDNVGGHLMQHGHVDIVITGTDRTTYTGDVCNKIGTYLKALAAKANNVPFYVGLPSPTIDWTVEDGVKDIPIEERDQHEVATMRGKLANGQMVDVQITPDASISKNFAFDVTPRHLITGLITERGISKANAQGLRALFPEYF